MTHPITNPITEPYICPVLKGLGLIVFLRFTIYKRINTNRKMKWGLLSINQVKINEIINADKIPPNIAENHTKACITPIVKRNRKNGSNNNCGNIPNIGDIIKLKKYARIVFIMY